MEIFNPLAIIGRANPSVVRNNPSGTLGGNAGNASPIYGNSVTTPSDLVKPRRSFFFRAVVAAIAFAAFFFFFGAGIFWSIGIALVAFLVFGMI